MYEKYQEYKKLGAAKDSKRFNATPSDIEGPYYKADAPIKKSLAANPNLYLHGKVYNTTGEVLADSVLDFWQADSAGEYDMVGFDYRGKVHTDSNGCYELRTTVPGDYLMAPNEYRCSHIHVKVSAPGHKLLTTQLYFEDDQYDKTDPWFNPQMVIGKPDGLFNFILEKL